VWGGEWEHEAKIHITEGTDYTQVPERLGVHTGHWQGVQDWNVAQR
jgi:hypothetical protein